MSAPVLRPIVERHAHDAAFLWSLRDRATGAPHFSRADLGRLDERIEAHLDGLRVAGPTGFALAAEQLAEGGPGEIFAAAVPALERGELREGDWHAVVLDAVVAAPANAHGLVSALGWIDEAVALPRIDALLGSSVPALARAGVAGAAVRRREPGAWLGSAAHAGDVGVRARALRAAGELGWAGLRVPLLQSIQDADPECRFWAAWSAALLGEAAGVAYLCEVALSAGPRAEAAVGVLAARLPPGEANALWRVLAAPEETRRLAVRAAGAFGDTARMPWLVEQARQPELARVSGEAMARLTGVDLEAEGLRRDAPDGFVEGPTDDPADNRVEMNPDADLPWPAVEAIERWWLRRGAALPAGVRRIGGEPIGVGSCGRVLAQGNQRMRAAAAVELAMLEPGRGVVNVRARADRGDGTV